MAIREQSLRFERKFVVACVSTEAILATIRRHEALFFEEHPSRSVNNIYFDTADLRNYHQNVDGHASRLKVRIRWYGELFGPVGRPVLEFKRKQGLLGSKDAVPLAGFAVHPRLGGAEVMALVWAAPLPDGLRPEVELMEPVLMNRYQRRYFRSADRCLRLTLDTGLEFFHLARHGNAFLRRARTRPMAVLELKYASEAHGHAARAVNGLPFRLGRMSKYVLGVDLLRGG